MRGDSIGKDYLPSLARALRPARLSRSGTLTFIPVRTRLLDFGKLAMRSKLGSGVYCKAAFLVAYSTRTSGKGMRKEYTMDMQVHMQVQDWLETEIWESFSSSGRLQYAREYDAYQREMMLEVQEGATLIRRYTNDFSGAFTDIAEIKVALDLLRGILIVRTPY